MWQRRGRKENPASVEGIQDTTRASLIFFGIEHTGCLGPEAMELGKAMAN
jgi:hypothetical protein